MSEVAATAGSAPAAVGGRPEKASCNLIEHVAANAMRWHPGDKWWISVDGGRGLWTLCRRLAVVAQLPRRVGSTLTGRREAKQTRYHQSLNRCSSVCTLTGRCQRHAIAALIQASSQATSTLQALQKQDCRGHRPVHGMDYGH